MRSLSIRVKLILSFGVIVLLNLIFGLYAVHSLAWLNGRVKETHDWTVSIAELSSLQDKMSQVRRADLNYMLLTSPEMIKKLLEQKKEAQGTIDGILQDYKHDVETLEYDSEEQRQTELNAINTIISRWNNYMLLSTKITELVDAKRLEEATPIIETDSFNAYAEVNTAMVYLADFSLGNSEAQLALSSAVYESTQTFVIVTLGLISVSSLIITVCLTRGIKRSINELLRVSKAIGSGDLTVKSEIYSRDEFGFLSDQYNFTISNIKALIERMQTSAKHVAGSAAELTLSAGQTAEGSELIAANTQKVTGLTRDQLTEIESMTSAITDMSRHISEISENIDTLAARTHDSVKKAREGSLSIEKAVSQMSLIEETVNSSAQVVDTLGARSGEIGEIVEAIAAISSQTNLLALNAAIEAARAGEHGRGFAVVAEEVKKLASESRSAAEKIALLISAIQEETNRAVKAMGQGKNEVQKGSVVVAESGHAFGDLAETSIESSEQIEKLAAMMQEMVSWTATIVSAVQGVETGSKAIAEDSSSVLAATEEQTAAMTDVSSSSKTLADVAQEMLEEVQQFTIE